MLLVAAEAFDAVGASYPFRHPCILLRFHSGSGVATDKLRKIPADHHEAVKIRSRLHRLPLVLEEMKSWRFVLRFFYIFFPCSMGLLGRSIRIFGGFFFPSTSIFDVSLFPSLKFLDIWKDLWGLL